ncbi:acetate--CoA ligase [Magnetococcales bacterium HHB-1]
MGEKTYSIPEKVAKSAHLDKKAYEALYKQSVEDPEAFWAAQAEKEIHWFKPWDRVLDYDFHKAHIRWFEGAKVNVSYNCLDRHLETRGDQVAILWEGDNPDDSEEITYKALLEKVCRLANVLKSRNVKKGDRVCIYMPMVPEAAVAMLACTRIGAIHSVVFGGFSPDSLKDRILDSDCQTVITADEGVRGGKAVPLRKNVDKALESCENVHTVITFKRTGCELDWNDQRDVWYQEACDKAEPFCPAEELDAEEPLFILYTSGSTGKPKGVLHTNGGYILYAAVTHKYIFDYHDGDIYWCTADVGWVTGHTYIVYGPLANGATTLMFEGVPNYPDASRFWQVVDKHQVNIFYTAPTALRALMAQGEEMVTKTDRSSLRLLGTVGEPINPEAWEWYYRVVGDQRCPIVDTWWQTETGGIMITPLPGAVATKPGSATKPFLGVMPEIVNAEGEVQSETESSGILTIAKPWPGMMRTVYGDHQRFFDTYFAAYPGRYFPGDGCRRDKDGYYWITGRVDDVIIVSGHNMGTAELESALVLHEKVAEAAVVGFPHPIKGNGIYAFVTLMVGEKESDDLRQELIKLVRQEIGPIATIDLLQWAPGLPKTRSGKIMRRILRKLGAGETEDLGDTSTLADPSVVDHLIENRLSLS